MNRILLLEDDVSLIDGLVYSLKKNEFDVEVARTVCEAKQYLSELDRYDLLILDVTLPDGTGFDVCERVRKENQQIPIIFLTASDEEVSIIRGLDSGGDDYITKPFKLGELYSRIRALLRRAGVSKSEKNTSMECGDITIDLLGSRATLKGKALDLTSAEYRLLCLLVRNANRVVTRDIILNELWDDTGNFVAGIVVGLVTVLFAAYSPAKKAAKVSPLAAVSGNANDLEPARNAANTQLLKIDTALGIYHAKANRKNLFLMTSSFALSIILFLSFSVTVEFMQHTLTPLQPWTADLSIISPDNACAIDKALLDDLKENPVVDLAYGRKFAYEVPSVTNGIEKKMDLISYEQYQFDWAKDYLLEGSLESVQTDLGTGLIVYNSQNTIQIGDTVSLNTNGQSKEIQIVGMLSDCPFYSAAGVGTIICSEDTFEQITGESKYTVIDVQLVKGTTDEDVYVIRQMVDSSFTFADERMGNSSTMGTYYCFWLFIYGFLVLIAMITIFNIINSISMSVSARLKQYGAFRAIGVSMGQLSKMIVAEAFTYTIIGGVVGTVLGLFCNKLLFGMLISYRWGDAWTPPLPEVAVILLIVISSVILAVHGPIKRIRNMSIVDTISAQ